MEVPSHGSKPGGLGTAAAYHWRKRVIEIPALSDQGIDKNLADREVYGGIIATRQNLKNNGNCRLGLHTTALENNQAVITAARAERHERKKNQRAAKEKTLSERLFALPEKKYAVVVADPEWRWEAWSHKGLDSTSADNHYPTSDLEAIKRRDVQSICADDCVLFTVPMMPQAQSAELFRR